MKELFAFLNAQNGDRLVGYGLIVVILAIVLVRGIVNIFRVFEGIFKSLIYDAKKKKIKKEDI